MLRDRLKDVNPDSSPGDEDEPNVEPTFNDKGQPQDRTPENVYREMRRRQEDLVLRMEQQFSTMEERLMRSISGGTTNPDSVRPRDTSNSAADKYSVQELRKFRDETDDPAKKNQLNDMINERIAQEYSMSNIKTYDAERKLKEAEEAANREALTRYPDLRSSDSEFYHEVETRLRTRADSTRPGVVLDVANEVAILMGITPIKRNTKTKASNASRGRNLHKPVESDTEDTLSDSEYDTIARRLAPAMKDGKFTAENKKSIKEKAKEVQNILDVYGPQAFRG